MAAENLNTYRDVFNGRPAKSPDTPLIVALRQLLDRLAACTSANWRQKHYMHWEEGFKAFQREAENNSRGTIPTLKSYFEPRRPASGAAIILDYIEVAGHFEVPQQLQVDPTMLLLRQSVMDATDMINDLSPHPKSGTMATRTTSYTPSLIKKTARGLTLAHSLTT